MTDAIALGLLGLLGIISTATSSVAIALIQGMRKNVAATKEQVVNDHPKSPNFREEQDSRHAENQKALRWIARNIFWLTDTAKTNRSRIDELDERTGQPPTTRRSLRRGDQYNPIPSFIEATDIPGFAPWDKEES